MTMDIDSDCTGAMKYVRATDPIDQRTWQVWFEPGGASWASNLGGAGMVPRDGSFGAPMVPGNRSTWIA